MALICPSCDVVPDAAARSGSPCRACSSRLMLVEDKDPLVGSTLDGRFHLRERLGSGAMGTVYRATQLSIGRDVAVKVITGIDATSIKRFFREAQIASALAHPNTVPIVDFGQSGDGRVYLAMELVRGHTLQGEIDAGAMAMPRICRIATQLCDALEAAHRMTIVHRDLKPENVMIAEDGTDHVRILDFGIARVLGNADTRLTSQGLSAGTPNYMAPEVLGNAVQPAPSQDIYALGVIIAELALGRALWNRETIEMLYADKTTNKAVEAVPPKFRSLVRKLVNVEPEARPTAAQVRDLIRQLERAATDPVGMAPTSHVAPLNPATLVGHESVAAPDLGALESGKLDLVYVDGNVSPPPPPRPTPLPAPLPEPLALAALAQLSEVPLELEPRSPADRASRASVNRIAHAPHHRRRGSGMGNGLVTLVLLAGAAASIYYVVTRPTNVTIEIVGRPGTPITIDGADMGKTPVSLQRTKSTSEIEISAPGFVRRIVPDHDLTIDIAQP